MKKMEACSRSELKRLIKYSNRQQLTPLMLFGSRQTKAQMVQALRRYWRGLLYPDYLVLRPKCKVPFLRFYFRERRWDFELPDDFAIPVQALHM